MMEVRGDETTIRRLSDVFGFGSLNSFFVQIKIYSRSGIRFFASSIRVCLHTCPFFCGREDEKNKS